MTVNNDHTNEMVRPIGVHESAYAIAILFKRSASIVARDSTEKRELWTGMHNLHVGLNEHFLILILNLSH